MKRLLCDKKGFSLMELIIVIAIMGVIAVIAIPNLFVTMADVKRKADENSAISISHAVMEAFIDGVVTENTNNIFNVPVSEGHPMERYLSSGIRPQSVAGGVFAVQVRDEGKCTITLKTSSGEVVAILYQSP